MHSISNAVAAAAATQWQQQQQQQGARASMLLLHMHEQHAACRIAPDPRNPLSMVTGVFLACAMTPGVGPPASLAQYTADAHRALTSVGQAGKKFDQHMLSVTRRLMVAMAAGRITVAIQLQYSTLVPVLVLF
jgi:hypothetical protein